MKINFKKVMRWSVWTGIIMLALVVSNKVGAGRSDLTLVLTSAGIQALGIAAPALMLVGLLIAAHQRSEGYVKLVAASSLVATMQFGHLLTSGQKYSLFAVGMLAFMRWLYPLLSEPLKDGEIVDISDAPSARQRRYG